MLWDAIGPRLGHPVTMEPSLVLEYYEEDERANAEGFENPAFDGGDADLSAHHSRGGREIERDRRGSALAAQQQKMELQAPAKPRGNECARNYFDPPVAEKTNPRQCGMEVGMEDELELRCAPVSTPVRAGAVVIEAQRAHVPPFAPSQSTALHRPGRSETAEMGALLPDEGAEAEVEVTARGAAPLPAPPGRGLAAQEELIPCYVEQLKECVRGDMIALGSLSLEQVEWARTPQPVEIRLLCLRAVRDKLPRGQYALSVALHARLGGRALRWSRLKERPWAGATERTEHRGRFYDTELRLNQSVFTVLPAPSDVLPSMVLQFQLLSLPGERSHVSAVVAWGAFPVCDCSFDIIQGNFRTPLLRGARDPALDQFRKMEALVSSDLDTWLCNLYFQVKKLPRGASDGAECSVALRVPSQSQPCPGSGPGSPLSLSARSGCSSASLRGTAPPPLRGTNVTEAQSGAQVRETGSAGHGALPEKGPAGPSPQRGQGPFSSVRISHTAQEPGYNKEPLFPPLGERGLWLRTSEFMDIARSCQRCANSGPTPSEHQGSDHN
ncbi:hypothetical protein AAFF_G00092030 [Aldrovandia affinis]|uniref:Uncharacterized protein n=1 Tax=Aldrovandia affinis TaxID=143900 RepID=A0AAD7T2H2_9TELE|nr:hypothetical protein AAFF_G00092030 [Aldrovandia affinis]